MKIGELAKATHTDIQTIRYYEREDLLHSAGRTEGNYRIYDDSHVDRLAFIRHCRSLDMALDEIRVLLRVKDATHGNCDDVDAVIEEHIDHVARRIAELKILQGQLKELRVRCGTPRAPQDCGILKQLSKESRGAKATVRTRAYVHRPNE